MFDAGYLQINFEDRNFAVETIKPTQMKRTATLIFCILSGIAVSMAQDLAEIFKGNDFLTEVFVNPLGISDLPDDADPSSVEKKIKDSGCDYRMTDVGVFGTVFSITPSPSKSMAIGEVPISGIGVCVNNDAVMVIYRSEATDNYMKVAEILDRELKTYAKSTEKSGPADRPFNIYMITDTYGIAVGTNEAQKTPLICLLDIRNLKGFLGLGSLFCQ